MRFPILITLSLALAAGPTLGDPRRVDPAVEQFWSDRCVQQRRDRRPHTKDCDNPAYTSAPRSRGGPYPYSYYPPHGSGWGEPPWRGPAPSPGWPRPSSNFRYPTPGISIR